MQFLRLKTKTLDKYQWAILQQPWVYGQHPWVVS